MFHWTVQYLLPSLLPLRLGKEMACDCPVSGPLAVPTTEPGPPQSLQDNIYHTLPPPWNGHTQGGFLERPFSSHSLGPLLIVVPLTVTPNAGGDRGTHTVSENNGCPPAHSPPQSNSTTSRPPSQKTPAVLVSSPFCHLPVFFLQSPVFPNPGLSAI